MWAVLGGLYAAIGMLFYWIMPSSHPHSLSVLWAFLGGLLMAIGMLFYLDNALVTPAFPLPHYFGLFALSLSTRHLIPLTHSTPTGLQCFAHIKCLGHQHHDFGLVCFVPSPSTTCSLTLPQQVSSTFHDLLGYTIGGLGVHRM